ncbi:MAG: adenylosuccinate synthase [Balneolaceae bacterium]
MAVQIVVGAQWGDEGKGKVVDLLSKEANYVIRYQGGANAGHTLKFDDQEVVLHLIPSGMFNGDATCIIGNGVVIDPIALVQEIEQVEAMGVHLKEKLKISESAHMILPYHKVLDQVKEKSRGKEAIGTTGRGIGPAYVSKVSRVGIRMADLLNRTEFEGKLKQTLKDINQALEHIYGVDPLDPAEMMKQLEPAFDRIAPYICNTTELVHDAIDSGDQILLEGAQGSLLDLDHGTYPFVTSSSPTAGGACTGSGIPPTAITDVIGITKAYCTRVGNGPFPTELHDKTGEELRKHGSEFGATTGRPRRCGWLDLVALSYAVRLNGLTEIAFTKLDVLDHFDEIQVCTEYEIDGERTRIFPAACEDLDRVKPIYTTLKGWKGETTRNIETLEGLPNAAQAYIKYAEKALGVPFRIISTGPKRSETIVRS